MSELDQQIKDALDAEDRALFDSLGEQGLIGQFLTVFQGKTAWVSIITLIFGAMMNIGFFYAAWKFFTVSGVDAKSTWAGIALFLMMMVAFMKVWFWMRMESNRVLREIKRVELQIARLNER